MKMYNLSSLSLARISKICLLSLVAFIFICQVAAAKTNSKTKHTRLHQTTRHHSSAEFSAAQKQAIQKIVHEYLIKNPQILLEVSQALQNMRAQQMTKMQAQTKNLIEKYTKQLFDTKNHFAIGNPNGNVVMIEFFDYQCAHCKPMNDIVNKLVQNDPKLEVVFVEWPIFGDNSIYAAKAALAARAQDKYIAMHDALLAADDPLTHEKVLAIAKSVGLDVNKLQKDITDKSIDNIIKANSQLAHNLKIIATPAFIFSNRQGNKTDFVLGQVEAQDLQQAITGIRAK